MGQTRNGFILYVYVYLVFMKLLIFPASRLSRIPVSLTMPMDDIYIIMIFFFAGVARRYSLRHD